MSNVQGYLKKMADEVAAKKKRSRGSEKRLTVILSEYDAKRLKYISKQLGETSGSIARNLIVQALNDAESILGLDETDYSEPVAFDEEGEALFGYTDYGHYINSFAGDDDDDED